MNALVDEASIIPLVTLSAGKFMPDPVKCVLFALHITFKGDKKTIIFGGNCTELRTKNTKVQLSLLHLQPCGFNAMSPLFISKGMQEEGRGWVRWRGGGERRESLNTSLRKARALAGRGRGVKGGQGEGREEERKKWEAEGKKKGTGTGPNCGKNLQLWWVQI